MKVTVPALLLLAAQPVHALAVADALTMWTSRKARISVLANDTGYKTPPVVAITKAPTKGTATVDASGKVLYTSTNPTATSDSFEYSMKRTNNLLSKATVNVNFTTAARTTGSFNVPSTPPPLAVAVTPAFGSLAFSEPVCLASPPGETKRLFVCQKGGLLRLVPDVTAASPVANTFLNLPTLLTSRGESIATGSEMGLLGLAFHPNYATNRTFFLFYSVNKGGSQYERVSRFTTQAGDPNAADTASETILIEQLDEAGNHNGGCIQFGPDGYLYISVGDEGNQNDSFQNGQKIDKDFFSAVMRIDVDKKPANLVPHSHASIPAGTPNYSIPADNPFVHTTDGGTWNGTFNGTAIADLSKVRSEFWAVGFRNPWRFSFDSATGELWLGDVGQDSWEEIDIVTKGGNYGWSSREAKHAGPRPVTGATTIDPIWEYAHGSGASQGNSVTGGVVYRGTRFSAFTGAYVFADYQSGNIWTLRRDSGGTPTVTRVAGEGGLSAFGTDPSNGDILMADLNGSIQRLVATAGTGTFPQTLTETNVFSDLTDLSPSTGLYDYTVNVPFWSDYAKKRRWFYVPPPSTLTWSQDDPWTFPAGTFWVKHFDVEMQRGVPASAKRIETRLFVKTTDGAYGVSYRWNDAGTEATLAPDEGVEFDLNVTDGGTPKTQRWHIPSRSECMTCHNTQAGYALSFNTRQLNLTGTINGSSGNQLSLLQSNGFFSSTIPSPNLLPRHLRPDETTQSLEARVRSYLAVNCSYCHQPGGGTSASWDGRPQLTLDATDLINGTATSNGGDPQNKLVVPGSTAHSVVYNRVAAASGFTRMPPIATSELDQTSIALLADWIGNDLPGRQTYTQWRQANFGSSPNGDPTADPDQDGRSNREEYLAGTPPNSGSGFFSPTVQRSGNNATVSFSLPANRSYQVQTSPDLATWTPWDIPGNAGIAHPGGIVTLTGAITPPQRHFFRVVLKED